MDFIHSLLIAEDDLDDGSADDLGEFEEEPADMGNTSGAISYERSQGSTENPEAAPNGVYVQIVGQCLRILKIGAAKKISVSHIHHVSPKSAKIQM